MNQTPPRIHVWDIDHTLLDSSLEQTFFKFMRTHGYHSWWRTSVNSLQLLFSSAPILYRLRMPYIRGRTIEEIDQVARECLDRTIEPMLRQELIGAIQAFNSDDVQQVLMSGAPHFLAGPLAEYVGIEDVIAGEPETVNGKYTGRLQRPQPYSRRKVTQLQEWIRSRDYDWPQVTAIADSWADRYLLRRVGKAVVVNPGSRLGDEAEHSGWGIIRLPSEVDEVISIVRAEK
jgi:HAD superfamily hydrolase (TIGR01490 family)